MKQTFLFLLSFSVLSGASTVQAQTIGPLAIHSRSNVFVAGQSQDTDMGGVLPVAVQLVSGTQAIAFEGVSGELACADDQFFSPDGGDCAGGSTDLNSKGTIAGIIHRQKSLFLVGVFLGATQPAAAPARLDFSDGRDNAEVFTPALNQVFFIGDGQTEAGATQKFKVPAGARMLYLGIADGYSFQGDPGAYNDNKGTIFIEAIRVNPK